MLTVLILVENDRTAIQKINGVMRGHDQLQKMQFSDTDREVSSSLPPDDLRTLFTRLGEVGKVTYSRKRFESFPAAKPVLFTLKLKVAPRTLDESPSQPKPSRKSPDAKYSEGPDVPSLPAAAPSRSAAP
jgi:hypothetical protein